MILAIVVAPAVAHSRSFAGQSHLRVQVLEERPPPADGKIDLAAGSSFRHVVGL